MAVDTTSRRLSRRHLLRGSGLALAGLAGAALVAACGSAPPAPPKAAEAPKPADPAKPAEAPKPAEAAKPAESKPAAPAAQPAATTAPAAAAPPKPAAVETTLKAMYWSASPEDHQVFLDVFGDFEKRNPGVKIDFDDVSSTEFAQVLLTRIVGGTPPDVVKLHASFILNFTQAKQLNDLTDMMKSDKSVFLPTQLDFWADQGRNFGVPYYSGSSFIFYNKSLFQKVGARTPEEHEKAGTWTWETLRQLAREVTTGTGAEKTFGWDAAQNAVNLQFYTCVPIWCNEAEMVNKEETAWLVDDPKIVEVMQWHADMLLKEKSVPLSSDLQGITWLFRTGRLGMAWAGRFRSTELVKAEFDVGMVGVPKGKVGPINRDGPNGTGLPAGTKNLDASYKLAMFIGSPEAAPLYLGSGATQPVRIDLLESDVFKKSIKPFERIEVFNESSKTVRAWRVPGKGPEASRALQAEWDKVLVGQQDVPTAMKNAKAAMDPLIKVR
jgi:multiple sugar transport system substrate-binding protein